MEEARVEIRNQRRDAVDEISGRSGTATDGSDEARREQDALQKVTDRWTAEVDRVGKHKEQEIMEVGGLSRRRISRRTGGTAERDNAAARGRPDPVPRHVAIIMDGNRRWAKMHGLSEAEGHSAGVDAIRPIVEHAADRGIEALSIYAF